jgi:hypothetical protein
VLEAITMRHVLIVANKTLHGDALLGAVKKKLDDEPSEFRVLVPATPLRDYQRHHPSSAEASIDYPVIGFAPYDAEEGREAYEVAEQRLEYGIERLRRLLGAPVDGEVGDSDPMHAITEVVTHHPVDEIIISTLPAHLSHWLHSDLPGRVHRKHHLPVTTVTHDQVPARA